MNNENILVCKNCGVLSDARFVQRTETNEESPLQYNGLWKCACCKEINDEGDNE